MGKGFSDSHALHYDHKLLWLSPPTLVYSHNRLPQRS